MDSCRVAVTLEQCWHEVPGGTARAALDSVAAVGEFPEIIQIGVSARHRALPPPPWRPSIEVRSLPLPRLALYESWHRVRRPRIERATGAVDVIHATGMVVPPPSAPLVVTVNDLAFTRSPEQFTRRGVRFFTRAIELTRRDADIVVCPSTATLEDCAAQGFDRARLRRIPYGVTPVEVSDAQIEAIRRRFDLPERFVLWAGTIEPRKNLPTLLTAFAAVEESAVGLVLVGPKGWNEDIERMLHRLAPRVRTLGFVDTESLSALYAAAEVFCFPSLEEGFGLPVLEAMARRTAVITSAGTATAEILGPAGILVDPRDDSALRDALDSVLGDDVRRRELADAGLVRSRTEFAPRRTGEALRDLYLGLAR